MSISLGVDWAMNEELERYLADVEGQLSVDPTTEREILREIRAHLEEAVTKLQEEGLSKEESLAIAIGEIFVRISKFFDCGQFVCMCCITHPHGCMGIDRTNGEIFCQSLYKPKRNSLK